MDFQLHVKRILLYNFDGKEWRIYQALDSEIECSTIKNSLRVKNIVLFFQIRLQVTVCWKQETKSP